MIAEAEIQKKKKDKQTIKCVVWDLDNTVWTASSSKTGRSCSARTSSRS